MQQLGYDVSVRKRSDRRHFRLAAAVTLRWLSAFSTTWRKSPALRLRKSAGVRAKKLSIDRPASAIFKPRSAASRSSTTRGGVTKKIDKTRGLFGRACVRTAGRSCGDFPDVLLTMT